MGGEYPFAAADATNLKARAQEAAFATFSAIYAKPRLGRHCVEFCRFGNRATGHRDFARDLLVDHLIARRARSADKQRLSSHRYAGFSTSLAMVLGLLLGRVVGELLGRRITFFAIGVLAAAETLFLWKILPFLPSRCAGSLASLPILARRPLLLALYLLTFLIVGAYFTTYSYIEPFVAKFNPAGDCFVSYVPLAFGASGIAASVLFSKLYRPFPNAFLICAILFILASVLTLKAFVAEGAALLLAAFVWGSGDFWLRALIVD